MNQIMELQGACWTGDWERVKSLVKQGADINAQGFEWLTPLHLAAQKGNVDAVKFLLENGADINKVTQYQKRTPLFLAAVKYQIEAAKTLLEAGSDINQTDGQGWTPLHWIVAESRASSNNLYCYKRKFTCRKVTCPVIAPSTLNIVWNLS